MLSRVSGPERMTPVHRWDWLTTSCVGQCLGIGDDDVVSGSLFKPQDLTFNFRSHRRPHITAF